MQKEDFVGFYRFSVEINDEIRKMVSEIDRLNNVVRVSSEEAKCPAPTSKGT